MKIYTPLLFLTIALLTLSNCTKDEGDITVTYQEATAVYGDLQAIRAEPINESTRPVVDPGKIFVGENFILIGEEQEGIHVIDNTNPQSPTAINFINIPGNREYFVRGNKIYAESNYDVLKIDISDLTNAKLDSRAEYVFQQEWHNDNGETLIGFTYEEKTVTLNEDDDFYKDVIGHNEIYFDFAGNIIPKSAVPASFAGSGSDISGTVNRVTYTDNYVYIVGQSSMHVLRDDSNGLVKVEGNHHLANIGEGMETVFPYQNHLFVGSRSSMDIFNIDNQDRPEHIYAFDHATSCDPVMAADDVAYITLRTAEFSSCPGNTNALLVLDISNLNDVDQKEEIEMLSPYGMNLIGNKLYVGEGENGLKIFDASDRQDPKLVKFDQSIKAYDVIPHPLDDDIIFTTGPEGIYQYTVDHQIDNFSLQSIIAF